MRILLKDIEIQNPYEESYVADILVSDGKIENIFSEAKGQVETSPKYDHIKDCTDKIITPGLIDRHTHGGYGCNFNNCNEEELQNYLINCQKHGIKYVLPTIMTDSIENINHQINLIKNTVSKGAKIIGIHLEGPFINKKKKGIHPEEYILEPTIENLNKIDTDFIKILTYAPELDLNGEFLNELIKRNILPSIGHTESDFGIAQQAFKNGAKSVTHLFNAMKSIHHREPSSAVAALNNDNVGIEIISDLEHVDKEIIKIVLKLKPKEKILLISDALPISYSNQTEAIFGGEKIYYDGKRAASKEGTLAGSTLYFDDIYPKINDFVPFKDFLGFASKNIAKSLEMNISCKVETGSDDFVIWDKKNYKISSIF